jgi:hypothetical protein
MLNFDESFAHNFSKTILGETRGHNNLGETEVREPDHSTFIFSSS